MSCWVAPRKAIFFWPKKEIAMAKKGTTQHEQKEKDIPLCIWAKKGASPHFYFRTPYVNCYVSFFDHKPQRRTLFWPLPKYLCLNNNPMQLKRYLPGSTNRLEYPFNTILCLAQSFLLEVQLCEAQEDPCAYFGDQFLCVWVCHTHSRLCSYVRRLPGVLVLDIHGPFIFFGVYRNSPERKTIVLNKIRSMRRKIQRWYYSFKVPQNTFRTWINKLLCRRRSGTQP